MPRCCSVPGCKSGHKQGLKLLCFPKDAQRRSSWVEALRNYGKEPTNNRFICELHFSPDQWEKVRVDGTRKLKWSGIPNILDPAQVEEAREKAKSRPNIRATDTLTRAKPPNDGPGINILIKNCFSLQKNLQVSSHSSKSTSLGLVSYNHTFQEKGSVEISEYSCEDFAANKVVPKSPSNTKNSVVIPSSNLHTLQSTPTSQHLEPNTSLESDQQSILQCTLPLSQKGQKIVVAIPKCRFSTRLSEDVEDVKSLLTGAEHTYEEKLVMSLSKLIKKHQLLDKKIQEIEALSNEHHALKRKLEVHEAVLLENYNLKLKLQRYEKDTLINSIVKKKTDGNNREVQTEERKELDFIVSEMRGNSVNKVVVSNDLREGDSNSFMPIYNQ